MQSPHANNLTHTYMGVGIVGTPLFNPLTANLPIYEEAIKGQSSPFEFPSLLKKGGSELSCEKGGSVKQEGLF